MIHSDLGADVEYDARSNTYRFQRGEHCETNTSTAVVTAVAEAVDREPTELEPLEERIDSDALDMFFDPDASENGRDRACRVTFPFAGCEVTVNQGRSIVVSAPE
ncbi:HalOD1 output domain-containing protein [Haloarcula sp. JP-L23]|uniref:HalOD1 output domain-containing protein n=1 Tax=Haloarcula sp. JP-L23 TaxID=2716717 RepID=UPI00140F0AE4|nr:hypothetical protein G9465_19675 [Haloarcula sp. JP-L23]